MHIAHCRVLLAPVCPSCSLWRHGFYWHDAHSTFRIIHVYMYSDTWFYSCVHIETHSGENSTNAELLKKWLKFQHQVFCYKLNHWKHFKRLLWQLLVIESQPCHSSVNSVTYHRQLIRDWSSTLVWSTCFKNQSNFQMWLVWRSFQLRGWTW